MTEKVIIGGYTIDSIEMFDNDACCLFFEDFNEDGLIISIVVEKWLDWHFMDIYFESDGSFIKADNSTHLSEEDKEKCKEFINSWLEDKKSFG